MRRLFTLVGLIAVLTMSLGITQLTSAQDAPPTDGNTFVMEIPVQNVIAAIVDANYNTWTEDPFKMFAFAVKQDGSMDLHEAWSALPTEIYASLIVPSGIGTTEIQPGLQFWALGGIDDIPTLDGLDSHDTFDACMRTNSCDPTSLDVEMPGLVRVVPTQDDSCMSYDFGTAPDVIWEYYDGDSYASGVGTIINAPTEYGWGYDCEPVWFFRFTAES